MVSTDDHVGRDVRIEIKIKCSSSPSCSVDFVLSLLASSKSRAYLYNSETHDELRKMLAKVLIRSDTREQMPLRCFDQSMVLVNCSSRTQRCEAKVADWSNWNITSCSKTTFQAIPVEIKTDTISSNSYVATEYDAAVSKRTISYACNFDACNGETVLQEIRTAIESYYSIDPLLNHDGQFETTFMTRYIHPSVIILKDTLNLNLCTVDRKFVIV